MLTYLKTLFKSKHKRTYRLVKEEAFDRVMETYFYYYYIEKKTGITSWTQIGPKFEDYSRCILWFDKYKEYLKKQEIEYEYLD